MVRRSPVPVLFSAFVIAAVANAFFRRRVRASDSPSG